MRPDVRRKILLFLPLALFLLLALLFYQALALREFRATSELTSALLNRPFPVFSLPGLKGDQHDQAGLVGRVSLVNVWGSWCPACRDEHPFLAELAEQGVPLIGLNYKDRPDDARAWLAFFGDIYDWHIQDRDGRLGLDLGVYGAPETFIVDKMGVIRYKRVGVVDANVWEREMKSVYLRFGGLLHED